MNPNLTGVRLTVRTVMQLHTASVFFIPAALNDCAVLQSELFAWPQLVLFSFAAPDQADCQYEDQCFHEYSMTQDAAFVYAEMYYILVLHCIRHGRIISTFYE